MLGVFHQSASFSVARELPYKAGNRAGWLVEISTQTCKRKELHKAWLKINLNDLAGVSMGVVVESDRGEFRAGVILGWAMHVLGLCKVAV